MAQLAVTGASGKTGWRVVEEALNRGHSVRAIARPASVLPPALVQAEQEGRLEVHRLELDTAEALLHALQGCTALVIATGARPSINLAGPLQVDAWGVQAQVQACRSLGVRRVVLVAPLCRPLAASLNLFGLILVWKRMGGAAWAEWSRLDRHPARRPQRRRQPQHQGGCAGDGGGSTAEQQHSPAACGAGVSRRSGRAAGLLSHPRNHQLSCAASAAAGPVVGSIRLIL